MTYSKGSPLNGAYGRESYADYMARRLKEEYPLDLFNNKAQKHEEAEAREKHPLNTLQQLMIITAEECGELTQVCSKTVRKFNTIEEANSKVQNALTNRKKLVEEAGDAAPSTAPQGRITRYMPKFSADFTPASRTSTRHFAQISARVD